VIDPELVARLFARRRERDPLAGLTERERAVLTLMAQGRSNVAVAAELHLAVKTVELMSRRSSPSWLAIQYGHMRTTLDARTSSGYASRSRGGLHSILDVETALTAADTPPPTYATDSPRR
jgi:hypothetical protein